MSTDKRRRLSALERHSEAQSLASAPEEPLVPLSEALVSAVRDGLLTYRAGRWQGGYYEAPLADILNEVSTEQPGAVFVPLWPEEFAEATEALEAGRFGFVRNSPPYDIYQPKDCRTGTPILCAADWRDQEAERLAGSVATAARLLFFQTEHAGGKMPATLAEFGEWLREVRPLALQHEQDSFTAPGGA